MTKKDPVQVTIAWYRNTAESYKAGRSDLSRDEDNRKYFLNQLKWKKILDVWCAHGRDIKEFYKNGMDVTGIDLTPEFVNMAKENCPQAEIQLMDMRELIFENKTFDGIRACASLLHIPKHEVKKTLQGFHRILKRWWLLYIMVKEWIGEEYVRKEIFNNEERFFAYRQKNEIEKILEDSHFKIQKSSINSPNNATWINIFAIAE